MQRVVTLLHPFLALILALLLPGCLAMPFPSESEARTAGLQERAVGAPEHVLRVWGPPEAEGPARRRLVFVHGTPGAGAHWADFLTGAPEGWEPVAYDRPGFGGTRARSGAARAAVPELQRQVEALVPLLRRTGAGGSVLVGHSLGGPIAALAAARHPELVDGLVIVAGSQDPGQERLRWYNQLVRWVPFVFPRLLRNANAEVLPLERELEQMEAALGRVRCPVLLIHGEEDTLVPFANLPWTAERLTAAARVERLVFPEGGHMLIWTQPEAQQVQARLARFLAELDGGPPAEP